jgi:DNA polymerase IV (DinB-like DNA polymerase)
MGKNTNKKQRIIGHIDMDAFFAAVEEKDHPWMKGKPIAVGSDPLEGRGRGVVSTANYKAREYGIRSATPISVAWRLSEQAVKNGNPLVVFAQPNFVRYRKESEQVMEIVGKYSKVIQQASIDEAYFDLCDTGSFEKALQIAKKIQKEILEKQKLSASIGIGPNKLIAKIASDFQKPYGITIVTEKEVEKFLEPMSLRKIPGIGPKTQELLREKGAETIRDLKRYKREELEKMLGKWGLDIFEKIRGRDSAPLVTEWEAKSIGEQETFLEDSLEINFLMERVKMLCESVHERFRQGNFTSFKTVVVTVRFSDFETKSRSHTLKEKADKERAIEFEALKSLLPFFVGKENPRRKKIRLLGVRIENLT